MKRILFRADGSKEIGMGHLNRSSIIGKEFILNGNDVNLLTKNNNSSFLFLKKKEIKIQTLPTFKSMGEEIEFLSKWIIIEKIDIFFLDVLNHVEYSELLEICKENNVVSVLITDESEKMNDLNANIILNGNPNQLKYNYDDFSGKYLAGPRYFIMDQDYSLIENNQPNEEIRNILVTLGGSDHNNLLFQVLKALDNICENVEISVITTNASGYIDELRTLLDTMESSTNVYVDVDSLTKYWNKCNIAVTAGGNTLFERISTRTPGATVCQLERQMEISDYFMKLGVNYNVGLGKELSLNDMENKLQLFLTDFDLQKEQYYNAKGVVSGDGLKLLMDELFKIPHLSN